MAGASVDWRDTTYRETFEGELRGLHRRRESDPSCTVKDIEGVLRHLYVLDGGDWAGRGDLQDVVMAATIAAHEQFIAGWKAEPPSSV
ncbi:MAG: hypothetical protein LBI86_10985 [Treponema sp.]|jgi:hypothetical protein|nr:hypothetical protein [Treponema sp.]